MHLRQVAGRVEPQPAPGDRSSDGRVESSRRELDCGLPLGRSFMQTASGTSATLRQSEGFVVESAGSRVGVVESLRYGATNGTRAPEFLVVRAGRLPRRRMMISVDDVREILPREKRVRLQATWMTIRT